ncbi:MAG: hypothetical protein IPM25_18360 [Chloracidobacterium sp.]|nr:hypothetical protein [Chloracidobacterium sp.]
MKEEGRGTRDEGREKKAEGMGLDVGGEHSDFAGKPYALVLFTKPETSFLEFNSLFCTAGYGNRLNIRLRFLLIANQMGVSCHSPMNPAARLPCSFGPFVWELLRLLGRCFLPWSA